MPMPVSEDELIEILRPVFDKDLVTKEGRLETSDEMLCVLACGIGSRGVISIELKKVFNKAAHCPIHFVADFSKNHPISKRKLKRLKCAIRFLLENQKESCRWFGEMPGYDDLGSHVRASLLWESPIDEGHWFYGC